MTGRRWLIAIAGVAVLTAGTAAFLLAVGSAMIAEADLYFAQYDFSTANPVEIDQAEFDIYNALYSKGSTLSTAAGPLLLCALGATLALLAVLSQRYDLTHRRAVAAGQTEAPAAS